MIKEEAQDGSRVGQNIRRLDNETTNDQNIVVEYGSVDVNVSSFLCH